MNQNVPFVIVESPYAGDIDTNVAYARACLRDSILKGEAPFASHLLYTQEGVLRDEVHEERELGMGLGWHVARHSDYSVFYTDRGWSSGMVRGFAAAARLGHACVIRRLGLPWSDTQPGDNYLCAESGFKSTGSHTPSVPENYYEYMVLGDLVGDKMIFEVDLAQGYFAEIVPNFGKSQVVIHRFTPGDFKALRIMPPTNNA